MEKVFWMASRRFWKTVQCLEKGNWVLSPALLGLGEELITQTEDTIEQ